MQLCGLQGLSPRVRGNRLLARKIRAESGSIPACAGEPPQRSGGRWSTSGLSPRVRGNLAGTGEQRIESGSIPACAGEPEPGRWRRGVGRVYPRVCGGTINHQGHRMYAPGLSPRVRGNRVRCASTPQPPGSIPACAGEPISLRLPPFRMTVYPRVCGGTGQVVQVDGRAVGLSPRVRGNRVLAGKSFLIAGSIPACAGEPSVRRAGSIPIDDAPANVGSIPACAGEPLIVLRAHGVGQLHPIYACAGEPGQSGSIPACAGEPTWRALQSGSIPACAGEPGGQAMRGD